MNFGKKLSNNIVCSSGCDATLPTTTGISTTSSHGSIEASRHLKRVFLRIDSLLPSSTSLVSEGNSAEYYRDQMEEARDFIRKLSQMVQREDLSEIHFGEINSAISKLRNYVCVIDRIRTSKLDKIAKEPLVHTPVANPLTHLPSLPLQIENIFDNCITKYDSNVLRWPMFWATYNDVVASNKQVSDRAKFRILYNNLDHQMKTLISDIEPLNPNLKLAFHRINTHFADEETIRYGIEKALSQIPPLKDSYNNIEVFFFYLVQFWFNSIY